MVWLDMISGRAEAWQNKELSRTAEHLRVVPSIGNTEVLSPWVLEPEVQPLNLVSSMALGERIILVWTLIFKLMQHLLRRMLTRLLFSHRDSC